MPIQVLAPQIANKIAAGEVVERPASVVKELIENAIDAGATDIHIETRQGGRRLIRVGDNGCGIPPAEVGLAFARHSTSKISSEDDLAHITTLGFRGEALASIAAVSQVTMLTRVASEAAGIQLRVEGGEIVRQDSHAANPGTLVSVENLFYNTPARLKFMRSESTESSHVIRLVSAYAIAFPELRFRVLDNGRLVLQTPGNGSLYDVLVKVYGLDIAQQLVEIEAQGPPSAPTDTPPSSEVRAASPEVHVTGYAGAPSLHRSKRSYEMLFVNRRWIQDRSISYAIEEAYRTIIPMGRYPVAVVNISLQPSEVDVNVHPTKREVRFRNPRVVFTAVQRAVRRTVLDQAPVAPMSHGPTVVGAAEWSRQQSVPLGRRALPHRSIGQMAMEIQRTAEIGTPDVSRVPMSEQLPMLRVLGQIRQTYIIAEGPDGLYLIDQHAAHERILFEQLQAEQTAMAVSSQTLLEPLTIDLPTQQRGLLEALSEQLAAFGFDIAPFGGGTCLVRAIPATMISAQVAEAISELLDAARESRDANLAVESTLAVIVCHSAIRAGQTLSQDEARQLIRQLENTKAPYTCPHGRPTMIHLSSAQLEKSFGRR